MPSFKTWDVVRVPFPYTDRPIRQRRPALVIVADGLQNGHGLLWVLMITSAENRGWPGDVAISDLPASGLPVASVVRTAKIATIEAADAETIGVVSEADRAPVRRHLATAFTAIEFGPSSSANTATVIC